MLDLSGTWTLTDVEGGDPVEMVLPGDGYSALHDADRIPDPYYGRNEYDLRGIADQEWVVRRHFTHAADGNEAWYLDITGLDTVAEVSLNGVLVLKASNQFRRYRPDVTEALKEGENEIEILFRSSTQTANALQKLQPFEVPSHVENSPLPNGNMLRKVQCDFGWDWNLAIAPFGLDGSIVLKPFIDAQIDDVIVTQDHSDASSSVVVALKVEVNARSATAVQFRCEVADQVVENLAGLAQGTNTLNAEVTLENPELWWPAGSGAQPLYDLRIVVGSEVYQTRIGIRTLDLVTERDEVGTGFKFRVNGLDTFAKGANWIPADALSGRISFDKTRDLLQSAVDANMNMIRVWGGGRYEPDWFYDLCDEMGLMVWQDFMFACNLYPSTPEFLAEVDAEVRYQVGRLQHHACIALWCGDNELIGALGWYEVSRENRDRYLVSYDRMNRTIETAMRETDGTVNWWPSSPSPGHMSFGDAWHDDSSGDMHFWSVWHEGKDFEDYRAIKPRFCSEFGFQSYTSMNVIRQFAKDKDLNIASPVMESHQKNAGGNARIAETMFRYFRFPEGFENFVYLSQVQQGVAIKTAVEYWRSLKPHCMGALYWQLNDTWPVASWSSLDYGGGWKLLHHMAKRFYRPVHCVVVPEDEEFRIVGINDLATPVEVTVTAYATGMDGAAREIAKTTRPVGEHAETLLSIRARDIGVNEVLTYGWEGSDGTHAGDIFAPKRWKSYDLPDPNLTCETRRDGDDWVLSVSAKAMAFFVAVEADQQGRWDKNAVHLGPGVQSEFRFTPETADTEPKFTLRDLYSATKKAPT